MSKQQAQTIQQRFGFADDDLKTPEHDKIMLWTDKQAADIVAQFRGPQARFEKVVWEKPVMSGKYIVGFIDLAIVYSLEGQRAKPAWDTSEPEIIRFNRLICVEVKSSIPSASELIRQIQMYQEYQSGTYVVVSPDARCADVLKSQGIEFYHYRAAPYEEAMK